MLITTTAQLMEFAPVSFDLDIRSIQPSLRSAERRFLLPLIGAALYEEMLEASQSLSLTAAQRRLFPYLGDVIGPLALYHYVQHGGVSVDGSGVYKAKNENRWNLSVPEQTKLEEFYLKQGLDASEELLTFLEQNADDFPAYAESAERDRERRQLVNQASLIQELLPSLYPRTVYRALNESLRYVETNRIAPALRGFFAYLMSTADAQLTADERSLRSQARVAAIYLATQRALLTRAVRLTEAGLEVMMGTSQGAASENTRLETAAREFGHSGEIQLQSLYQELLRISPTGFVPLATEPVAPRAKSDTVSKIFFI
jgi:hypothetical protein